MISATCKRSNGCFCGWALHRRFINSGGLPVCSPCRTATAVGVTMLSLLFFSVSTYFTSNLYYAPSIENGVRTAVSFPVGWYVGTVNGPPEALVYGSPRDVPTYTSKKPAKNNIICTTDIIKNPALKAGFFMIFFNFFFHEEKIFFFPHRFPFLRR